jgi:hypothetical protein
MAYRTVGPQSQTTMLLDHFRVKRDISAQEAHGMFRIRSLSRRINDLEAQGHRFSRVQRTDTTGQRYVRYFYLGKGETAA